MLAKVIVLFLLTSTAGVLATPSPLIVPCKRNDEVCMTKSANLAAAMIAPGIPSLGVESLEPIRIQEVSGKIENVFLNISNNILEGYGNCSVSGVNLDIDAMKLKFDVTCPSLVLKGYLIISGKLLDVPVNGNGDFIMSTGRFLYKIDANVLKVASSGKDHLAISTFDVQGIPLDPFQFEYDSLKPEIKLTGEALDNFEKNKYLKIVEKGVPPFVKMMHAIVFKSVNKYLENIPFDNLFID